MVAIRGIILGCQGLSHLHVLLSAEILQLRTEQYNHLCSHYYRFPYVLTVMSSACLQVWRQNSYVLQTCCIPHKNDEPERKRGDGIDSQQSCKVGAHCALKRSGRRLSQTRQLQFNAQAKHMSPKFQSLSERCKF